MTAVPLVLGLVYDKKGCDKGIAIPNEMKQDIGITLMIFLIDR